MKEVDWTTIEVDWSIPEIDWTIPEIDWTLLDTFSIKKEESKLKPNPMAGCFQYLTNLKPSSIASSNVVEN